MIASTASTPRDPAPVEAAPDDAGPPASDVAALAALGLETFDALAKSRLILLRGVIALHKTWLGVARITMDESWAAVRALSRCRSPLEVIELQNALARTSVGRISEKTRVLVNMSVQVSDDAVAPLRKRVASVVGPTAKDER